MNYSPTSYTEAKSLLNTPRRIREGLKIANNTRLRFELATYGDKYPIRLHGTDIVTFAPNQIVLNSGGWRSATTMGRLTEYVPGAVHSSEGDWYVRTQAARPLVEASPYLYGWVNDATGRKTNGPAHREAVKQGLLIPFRDGIVLDAEGFAL